MSEGSSMLEAEASEPSDVESLGSRLRSLRRERGLSLGQVSEGTGISASFLSLVENGRSDVTIGRLRRIADFYGMSIAELLPGEGDDDDADVVRAGHERKLQSPDEGIDVYLLTNGTNRAMVPMLIECRPGAALAEYGRHGGDEFVHVLEGVLLLDVEGSEPRELAAGDSAYYRGDRPHLFRNASDTEPLRLVCIDTDIRPL